MNDLFHEALFQTLEDRMINKTRLYAAKDKHGTVRLIEAPNLAKVARHIVRTDWEIKPVNGKDAAKHAAAGIAYEVAGEDTDES